MSLITKEYTTLVDDEGNVVQKILPGIEFDEVAPGCINTAYCSIKEGEEIVMVLKPGYRTPVKEEATSINYDEMSKSDIRELLIQAEIPFKVKATKAELIELLC